MDKAKRNLIITLVIDTIVFVGALFYYYIYMVPALQSSEASDAFGLLFGLFPIYFGIIIIQAILLLATIFNFISLKKTTSSGNQINIVLRIIPIISLLYVVAELALLFMSKTF